MKWLTLLLWAAGLAMLGAGLYLIVHKHGSSNASTTTFSTVPNPPPSLRHTGPTLLVYQVTGPDQKLSVDARPVRSGAIDAAAALKALNVAGTLSVANGTAKLTQTRTLQDSQIAEIVWTLTQFPSIKRVDVAGKRGLTRADEAAFAPPILIEAPLGPTVPRTFHVKGTAMVFEGTLVVKLQPRHGKAIQKTVTATAGAPDLGTFDTVLRAAQGGPATLTVYAPSAATGAPQHAVTQRFEIAN